VRFKSQGSPRFNRHPEREGAVRSKARAGRDLEFEDSAYPFSQHVRPSQQFRWNMSDPTLEVLTMSTGILILSVMLLLAWCETLGFSRR
jgi:hypothetical protein